MTNCMLNNALGERGREKALCDNHLFWLLRPFYFFPSASQNRFAHDFFNILNFWIVSQTVIQ